MEFDGNSHYLCGSNTCVEGEYCDWMDLKLIRWHEAGLSLGHSFMQREGNFFVVREGIRGKIGGMHVAGE